MAQSVAFDRAVEYYDETRGFPPGEVEPVTKALRRAGHFNADSRVLEIGVGTGRIALPVSKHVKSYYGVDISRPMMNRLQAKQQGEPIYIAEGDATQLPYGDHIFDGAVVVHVFHLIPGWKAALDELGRVLKPGAPMVHCWTHESNEFHQIWEVWNKMVNIEERRVGVHWANNPNFIEDSGWKRVGEPQTHTYTVTKTAAGFLERFKQRCWSAMWNVTDEELERGLKVLEPMLDAEYPDRNAPIEGQSTFMAQAYLPPGS